MTTETVASRSNAGQRIIVAGLIIGFCYWAASVVMTLLLSVLLAYLLDPLVEGLERWRIPRALGALLVVVVAIALVVGLGYLVYDRVDRFVADWPRYSAVLKEGVVAVDQKLRKLEEHVSRIAPQEPRGRVAVQLEEQRPLRALLLRGLGPLYSILLAVTFVPFLVLFMLVGKRSVWHGTMQLFPFSQRTQVKQTLEELSALLRSFMLGNAVVAAILVLASWLFFWVIGLDYPFLTGVVSGLVNLVPYLGAVLAWIPAFVIGLAKWKTMGPYLGIAVVLGAFHLIAINVLMPSLVGRRVHLNALAVTIALLFWGWLWGAIGLILAIPITATLKVICDHVEGWRPVGRWLGA